MWFRLNKLLPFPIQFHFFFWLLFAGAVITGQFQQLLLLISIVFMHEIGHIVVARYYGWQVTRLTLLPFGGVVEMNPPSREVAREELWITIAGPIMNGILVIVGLLLYGVRLLTWEQALLFVVGNGAIALFNLLPIYPLDGGRLFQIILSLHMPFRRAILFSLYSSIFFIVLLFILSFWFFTLGPQLWLILPYLVIMIILELRRLPYRFLTFLLARYSANKNLLQRTLYIPAQPEQTLKKATEQMHRHRYHLFKVKSRHAKQKNIYFGEDRILAEMFEQKRPLATFAEITELRDIIRK